MNHHSTPATVTRCAAFAIFLLLVAVAHADDKTCQQEEEAGLQTALRASNVYGQIGVDCYGVEDENNPVTTEVRAILHKKGLSSADIATALKLIAQRVSEHPELYQPDVPRKKFTDAMAEVTKHVEAADSPGMPFVSPVRWQFGNTLGPPATVPELNVGGFLDAACAMKTSTQCKDGILTAKAWIRVIVLTESALIEYSSSYVSYLAAQSALRLSRWHAYRDNGLPQFQWEWFVNSWRLTHKETRPLDDKGQPQGPREVPTDQIIFLHPGVGVEWRDAVTSGSKTQAAVYLELVGINRWSWDDDTANMSGGSAISIVSTYAKRNNVTKVGYGLMFHFKSAKPFALAITKSGGDTSIVLNVDLAEFVKDKMDYWKGVDKAATDGTTKSTP